MGEPTALDMVVRSLTRIERKVDTLTETIADRPTRAELDAVEARVVDIDKRQSETQARFEGRSGLWRQAGVAASTTAGMGLLIVGVLQLH